MEKASKANNALFCAILLFMSLIVSGLILEDWAASYGGPEDDPVHGTYVVPPMKQAVLENREAWIAELEADWVDAFNRRWDEWNAAWPRVTWEQRAWFKVYHEWTAAREAAAWKAAGGRWSPTGPTLSGIKNFYDEGEASPSK